MNNSEWQQSVILMRRSCGDCRFFSIKEFTVCRCSLYLRDITSFTKDKNFINSKPEWCTASKVIVEEKRNG